MSSSLIFRLTVFSLVDFDLFFSFLFDGFRFCIFFFLFNFFFLKLQNRFFPLNNELHRYTSWMSSNTSVFIQKQIKKKITAIWFVTDLSCFWKTASCFVNWNAKNYHWKKESSYFLAMERQTKLIIELLLKFIFNQHIIFVLFCKLFHKTINTECTYVWRKQFYLFPLFLLNKLSDYSVWI